MSETDVWQDMEKNPPPKEGVVYLGLHNFGMCFFIYRTDPLDYINGLFYVPRYGNTYGLLYETGKITHWAELPELPSDYKNEN